MQERSERLFLTKGKKLSDLNPNIFAKTKPGKEGRKDSDKLKDIAKQEAYIYRFAELLADVRNSTVENVERKQARTDAEREESDDEDVVEEVEEEPEDDIPYNPKNLPLGWDGKPIPYWLYKLHGLNISYNCEICGNFTYKVTPAHNVSVFSCLTSIDSRVPRRSRDILLSGDTPMA